MLVHQVQHHWVRVSGFAYNFRSHHRHRFSCPCRRILFDLQVYLQIFDAYVRIGTITVLISVIRLSWMFSQFALTNCRYSWARVVSMCAVMLTFSSMMTSRCLIVYVHETGLSKTMMFSSVGNGILLLLCSSKDWLLSELMAIFHSTHQTCMLSVSCTFLMAISVWKKQF